MVAARVSTTLEHVGTRQGASIQRQTQKVAQAVNGLSGNLQTIDSGGCEDAVDVVDPSWAQPVDTFTSATVYAPSSFYKCAVASALKSGDVIEIVGRYVVEIGGSTVLNLRLAIADGNKQMLPRGCWFGGNAASYTNETGVIIPIFARYQLRNAASPGSCTLTVQGLRSSGSGAAILLNTSGFSYRVLR